MRKIIVLFAVIILISIGIFPKPAKAETIVDISPRIQADSYLNITNPLNSDAFLIGEDVEINSEVNGNIFVLSKRLIVNSPIQGSLYAITIDTIINNYINGSFGFISSNINIPINGEIEKDVYGITEEFTLDGRIGRNLNLVLSPNSITTINGKVIGDFIYSDSRPFISEGAFIQGDTKKIPFPFETASDSKDLKIFIIFSKLIHTTLLFFVGLFIYATRKKLFIKFVNEAKFNILRNFLTGGGVLITLLGFALFLIFTFFGIPLSIIIMSLFFTIFYLSPIVIGVLLGNLILTKKQFSPLSLLTGLLVYDLSTLMPFLGSLLALLTGIYVLGMLTRVYFRGFTKIKK